MKFLLAFFSVLVFSTSIYGNQKDLLRELNNLSNDQRYIMVKTFMLAKKYDYEYTMTAIAWQESDFGKYVINLQDPSFGVFHNLIESVANRHNVKGKWHKSRLAEALIKDYNFSFVEALSELKYWESVYKKQPHSWSKIVSSYNSGWNYKNGKEYLDRIKEKIKVLKIFFKQNDFKYR